MFEQSLFTGKCENTDDLYNEIKNAVLAKLPEPVDFSDTDNLIKLGLDSLKIMRLVNEWRKKGYKVKFADLIKSPTLKDWHFLMQDKEIIYTEDEIEKAEPADCSKPFNLTDVQYAYWVGRNDDQPLGGVGCHAYIELDGKNIDAQKLSRAWDKLNNHHPMLRAVFLPNGTQKINNEITNKPLFINDLTNLEAGEIGQSLIKIRKRLSNRKLEVEKGIVAGLELSLLPDKSARIHFDIDLLIADVHSLNILLRDLGIAYKGEKEPAAPKNWNFAHYLEQESKRRHNARKNAEEYWKKRLPSLPKAPLLPLKKQPHEIKKPFFTRRQYFVKPQSWKELKKNSAINRLTPAMVLLTAYAEILDAWSANSKFLINIPLFNRQTQEAGIEDVVADFTNLLLLGVDCEKKISFLERAIEIQNQFHEDVYHCAFSGVAIQRELAKQNKGRGMAAPVVFASNIGSEFIQKETEEILGKFSYMISQTPQVWLDFQLYEKDGGLLLTWDSIDELFHENMIDDMFLCFSKFIDFICTQKNWDFHASLTPKQHIQTRQADILFEQTDSSSNLFEPFFDFAKKNPLKTALIIEKDKKVLYGDLCETALKISSYLKSKGVKKNDAVAVILPMGKEQIASVFGILAAGCCYVPVNTQQPAERRNYILKKSGAVGVIADPLDKNSFSWPNSINVFDIKKCIKQTPAPFIEKVSLEETAYIIFTSGSTGNPKGVEITHKGAVNTINDINEKYGVDYNDKAVALSSLEFDLSVYDIFGILGKGGTLAVVPELKKLEPDYWLEIITEHQITILNCVPAFCEMLVSFAELQNIKDLPLKLVMLSGDWIGPDLLKRLFSLAKECRLCAMGGATEASIWSNFIDVQNPVPKNWKSVPYGRPLKNQCYRVVDNKERDCPNWVPGELWIGGEGVAVGYRGDKELTHKHFVTKDNIRWFKTGDLGRFWDNGIIEFLGRKDFQVKISGHRIETGEIEEVLKTHPKIKDSVVLVYEDFNTTKHLAAFIVPNKNNGISEKTESSGYEAFGLNSEVLTDPLKRLEFKMDKPGIRKQDKNSFYVELPKQEINNNLIKKYSLRTTFRNFEETRIELKDFFNFISCLAGIETNGTPFLKYRYASAGGLYPVQTYVYVKNERIGRLAGGLYYFNPLSQSLEMMSSDKISGSIVHGKNREIFEKSAFSLFFVADYNAVKPIYGEKSRDFCLIEAGIMAHLLEASCFENNIGLCQIGVVDFSKIEKQFFLKKDQECLLCMFGGSVNLDENWNFLNEMSLYTADIKNQKAVTDLSAEAGIFLEKKLPSYMIPSVFELVEELPLSSNGKIDRKALLKVLKNKSFAKVKKAPKTSAEKTLCEIWQEIFKLKEVSVDDNFFDLGGDSLLAVQFVSRVRKILNFEISIGTLFAKPTIAELSLLVSKDSDNSHENKKTKYPKVIKDIKNRYEPFPLTDIQEAYWVGRNNDFELGNVSTHFYIEIENTGIDIPRLNSGWQKVIEQHEMLRTVILPNGTQQILNEIPKYKFKINDLSSLSEKDETRFLNSVRNEMSHQVISVNSWPLFDIRVSCLRKGVKRLHISCDALIADAWSYFSFINDWYKFYENPNAELKNFDLSFRDYVIAEKQLFNTEMYEKDKKYWMDRIETIPGSPGLPLAKNPDFVKKAEFKRRSCVLEKSIWEKLKNKAKEKGLTPSGLLLSAYAEILGSWSSESKFCINLTLFNRLPLHNEVNDIVGDFTSLVPLEIDGSKGADFISRAVNIQKQLWKDLDHGHFSGVKFLREIARLKKDFKKSPMPVVFTSALNMEPLNDNSLGLGNFGKWVYGISQTPQVWLDHQVLDHNNELTLIWDAVEELFPNGMLDDMFASYLKLLESLANENLCWENKFYEITPDYQLKTRQIVNNTDTSFSNGLLHSLFEESVLKYGDCPALISNGKTISYKDLNAYSTAFANILLSKGGKKGKLTAVVMEKGYEQIISVFAILKAGGGYIPIDPDWPQKRIDYILENAGADTVVTQFKLKDRFSFSENINLVLFNEEDLLKNDYCSNNLNCAAPCDTAYVIYTSGSTGNPKGVVISHESAVNTIKDINKKFEMSFNSRVLCLSNLFFDLSVYDIFGILGCGGALVIPDSNGLKDPSHWLDLMKQHKVSVWNSVPALMEMLLEYAAGISHEPFNELKTVLLSGDWVLNDLMDKIKSFFPKAKTAALGGATEASIWSNFYMADEKYSFSKSVPYGKPLANQRYYILNNHMKDCPDWVLGNLFIGGKGLAQGYLADDEKTKNSFIIHPKTGERLYKTGDTGRYFPDGNIEFLGRQDFQVKINGYRVELGEVEAALNSHENIRNCAAAVVKNSNGKNICAAYVVFADDHKALSEKEIQAFLRNSLPKYMIPEMYMFMDNLPVNSNGKINRKALPKFTIAPAQSKKDYAAPKTNTEEKIAEIFKDITNIPMVSVDESFFDLGANSMDLVRFQTRLKKDLNIDCKIVDFFEYPTIRAFCEHIEKSDNSLCISKDLGAKRAMLRKVRRRK